MYWILVSTAIRGKLGDDDFRSVVPLLSKEGCPKGGVVVLTLKMRVDKEPQKEK